MKVFNFVNILMSLGITRLYAFSTKATFSSRANIEYSRANNRRFNTLFSNRLPVVAGNWKLNPSGFSEAVDLLKLLRSNFINHDRTSNTEVIIFPPYVFLGTSLQLLEGTGIQVGSQNIGLETKGAFTGEVGASQICSIGCNYILLGHSERRTLYRESDEQINRKVHLSLEQPNLGVMLCIGETLEEYEDDLLESVVTLQVKKGLQNVSVQDLDRIIIAYEPVWAIGTGKVATPAQAQKAHVVTRNVVKQMFGDFAGENIRILYGGSVSPESIVDLMSMEDVDGALVGGASLNADSFSRIVDGATPSLNDMYYKPREMTAREVVSCKNTLGESPVWSVRDQTLYWISAPDQECWAWDLESTPYRRLFDSVIGCIGLQSGPPGSIVIAGERAFMSVNMGPQTNDFASGPTDLSNRPEENLPTRPNDGRTDRCGNLVFGMYNNYHRSGSSVGENTCQLYRMNAHTLEIEQILDDSYGYRVSNCISFSPSNDKMYFCDTPTRKIYSFDYSPEPGSKLMNRQLLYTMPSALPGGPDGAQVDTDGYLWAALSGAGKVVRIDTITGEVDLTVNLPVKSPTSVTFGGADLDELFITTRGPDGGGLYRLKMPYGIRGLPEAELAL